MDSATKPRRRLLAPLWARLERYDGGRAWRTAAEANGLDRIQVKSFLWMTTSVEGWLGPLHVKIGEHTEGVHGPSTLCMTVSGIARGLALRAEGIDTRFQKRLGLAGDIETGDATFDQDLLVSGSAPLVHALLDADTRRALRRLFAGAVRDVVGIGSAEVKARLAAGELVVDFLSPDPTPHLPDTLKAVLDLAQRLLEPDDIGARIARNAIEDRADGVRSQCLLALIADHSDHAAFRATLLRACDDTSEDVRLQAALALEDEGRTVLRALASSAEAEPCAAAALSALGAHVEAADALALLERSLRRRRLAVAAACVEALRGRGGAATVAVLERVLAEESGLLALAAARGLASPDLDGAEGPLIARGLIHSDEAVRVASADALARVGTVTAVLPLREAAAREGGRLRRAARQAMAEIQSRLTGAEPGQLSVSGAEGGAVTLASEGGEVSLPARQQRGS